MATKKSGTNDILHTPLGDLTLQDLLEVGLMWENNKVQASPEAANKKRAKKAAGAKKGKGKTKAKA